jgi:hypothetical protein
MRQRYIIYPFASSGDNTPDIPMATDSGGAVSYEQGYTFNYQRDLATDPAALAITRIPMNSLYFDITTQLQQYQQAGFPEWITSANNAGSPFAYDVGSIVRYSSAGTPPFTLYYSLSSSNTDTPPSANWLNVSQLFSSFRVKLNANVSFYVATTGNDTTGNGTSGAPWATLQHAWNVVCDNYDLSGFIATINVANGTYSAGVNAQSTPVGDTQDGNGILFLGNAGSPSSVIVSVASGTSCFEATNGGQFSVSGFTVEASGSAYAISAAGGSTVNVVGPMIYGACAAGGVACAPFGTVVISSSYTINGNQGAHWNASQGFIVISTGVVVTLTGTPNFTTAFANTNLLGVINCLGLTFTGSATGQRYNATQNSVINTSGGGATYLPGNTAGASSSGGLYV